MTAGAEGAQKPQRSNMFICCCAPCYVYEIEGCSPVAICCFASCFCGMWPWNGIAAMFYKPSKENASNPYNALHSMAQPMNTGTVTAQQNPDGSVTYRSGFGGATTVSPNFNPHGFGCPVAPAASPVASSPPQQRM